MNIMDLKCEGEQMPDGTWTITVTAAGLVSLEQANKVSKWIRRSLMEKASEIGVRAS